MRSTRSTTAAVVSLTLLAGGLATAFAPAASAAPTPLCSSVASSSESGECLLLPGETLSYTVVSTDGAPGGAGGFGGNGGLAFGGFPGGVGGQGGVGGLGGAGVTITGSWTNSGDTAVTVQYQVNASAPAAGANGDPGQDGADGTPLTPFGGNGGFGGDGGAGQAGPTTTLFIVEPAVSAQAAGGMGGTGGLGGQGGMGGTDLVPGTPGANGLPGFDGDSGAGLSIVPEGATVQVNASPAGASVAFTVTTPQPAPDPAPAAAAAARYTVVLEGNGGSCTTGSISGDDGSWAALPAASDCSKDGVTLAGWETLDAVNSYAPGASVQLTGDNTLRAVWSPTGAAPTAPTGPAGPAAPTVAQYVIWRVGPAGTPVVAAGDPTVLAGRTPVFTVSCTDLARVTRAAVAEAKALAVMYGGTYAGVTKADHWVKPRIVAAYTK